MIATPYFIFTAELMKRAGFIGRLIGVVRYTRGRAFPRPLRDLSLATRARQRPRGDSRAIL